MNRIVKAELYKISNVPSFIFSLLFALPAGILWAALATAGGGVTLLDVYTGIGSYANIFLITLIVLYVTNDYEKGTIKAIVSSGVSKSKIYFGRMLVSVLIAETGFLLALLGTTIYVVPFTDLQSPDWTVMQYASSIIIQMLFVLLYAAIGYFIAVVVRKQTFATLSAVLLVGLEPLLVGGLSKAFHINLSVFDVSAISQEMESLQITGSVLAGCAVFVAVAAILSVVVGARIFVKRDV